MTKKEIKRNEIRGTRRVFNKEWIEQNTKFLALLLEHDFFFKLVFTSPTEKLTNLQ